MHSVPIIAMTANAMESDKEACRAAGMVDHVAKPIDLEILIRTLLRHLAPDKVSAGKSSGVTDSANIAAPPAPTCSQVATSVLDTDTALARLGGSRAFYDKVLVSFRIDAPAQLSEAKQHLEHGRLKDATCCAHTLKGLAATIGAGLLSNVARALETELRTDVTWDTQHVQGLIDRIQTQLEAVFTEIGAPNVSTADRESATPTAPLDTAALLQALDELTRLLAASNMRSMETSARIVADHASALMPSAREQLRAIDSAVNQFDFTGALALCKSLRDGLE
ncbi:MAG: Hpt domain-containing protein [Rhodocyclaceae bacterium]|nr:Hpt domain-containing protein [Rhodocyclaceae bacterium]